MRVCPRREGKMKRKLKKEIKEKIGDIMLLGAVLYCIGSVICTIIWGY